MYHGISRHEPKEKEQYGENRNGGGKQEETLSIINRLLRRPGIAERLGSSSVLDQLELTPIPRGAVLPISISMMKASILDSERIRLKIPLFYIFLESYELGTKGSKRFDFLIKDLAAEQLAGKTEESLEEGIEEQ